MNGGVTAEFGFRRTRAGGNGRARRDDGVCLSAGWARSRDQPSEFAVKAISDQA